MLTLYAVVEDDDDVDDNFFMRLFDEDVDDDDCDAARLVLGPTPLAFTLWPMLTARVSEEGREETGG